MPNTDHWPPAFQSLVLDREISNFTLKRKDKTIIDWRQDKKCMLEGPRENCIEKLVAVISLRPQVVPFQ